MKRNKTIAIDFDGTIVDFKFPKIGDLKPWAKETVQVLREEGWRIIIWTCRGGIYEDDVKRFLLENSIPFDTINNHTEYDMSKYHLGGVRKVYADIYIDDRNIFHIDDWSLIATKLGIWDKVKEKFRQTTLVSR